MDRKYAEYLLNKTRENYNLIAEDWARKRGFVSEEYKIWLPRYIIPGEKVLDLGCGHGRFIEFLNKKNINYFGVDSSEKMIEIAKNKYPYGNFQITDILKTPFSDNFFDKVVCFAVFHHIPSEEIRLLFLKEIKRILKKGGALILTVWNIGPLHSFLIGKWHRAFYFLGFAFLKIIGLSKLDFNDFFLPWGIIKGRIVGHRYFHCFNKSELRELTKRAGFKIKEEGILKGEKSKENNIYLIAEK